MKIRRAWVVGVVLVASAVLQVLAADSEILLRVERRAPDDLSALTASGIPVVAETNGALFVEGSQDHKRWLDDHGYRASVVDREPHRWDYLQVGLRPDSDLRAVRAAGLVLLEEENWVLLRVPRDATPDGLQSARVFVARLSHDAIPAPPPAAPRGLGAPEAALPLVQKIVNAVSPTQIDAYWADLTSNPPSGTRYSTAQGCRDASTYVHDRLAAMGLAVEYQSWNAGHAPNTIGTLTGAIRPDVHYIVEGHLDDLPSSGPAPGADDNASGSVNVLESARVMNCYPFKNTVKFMTVTGEEFGLYGSEAYADAARARGDNIQGVINMDMIGWAGDGSPSPENLDLDYNTASQSLAEAFAQAATDYATGLVVDPINCPSLSASDHYPFWQNGYKAVCGITDNEGYCGHGGNYPYYHTSNDTIANCGNKSFFHAVVKTSVATLAQLAEPFKIAFDRAAYGCAGTPVQVVLGDRDLNSDPGSVQSVTVQVWSGTEPDPETVVLGEQGNDSMIFKGSIPTTSGPAIHGDGLLSIAPGDTIRTRYVDALDCDGATGVEYAADAATDCVGPIISGVTTGAVSDVQATIQWTTDEASDSTVTWGPQKPPTQTKSGNTDATAHQVQLTGLQSCTVYYYSVRSADPAGNVALDDNGGQYYHFETLGNFGSGLQPCHAGKVSLDRTPVSCSDTLPVRLVDMDLNVSSTAVDSAWVSVSSTSEPGTEMLVLTETGPNTSTFTGSIATSSGAPVAGDGVLQTSHGEVLTATYHDPNDGTGSPAVSFASGTADCSQGDLTAIRVTDLTDESAVVRWNTSEPAIGKVDWGATPALGNTVAEGTLATAHALTLAPLTECGRLYFRVTATDAHGNSRVADASGSPFVFDAYAIPSGVFKDGFETATGWTLEGEWQIGAPEGRGSAPGDPTMAFAGTKVLGHDLTGLGPNPGDYEPKKTERAISPVINAASLTQGRLKFRRWLNVGGGAISTIEVKNGSTWYQAWAAPTLPGITESSWSLQTVDISAWADGNASLQIAFKQNGGISTSANRAGWNLDRVIVNSGSSPAFDACGGCAGTPSFAGASSARDADPCADTGVDISWSDAVAWGTGHAGSYSIYRDPSPSFVPSVGNRVATGVAGTTWRDTSAPNGTTLYYIVRAENDETCSTGPKNGGTTDSNLVRVPAIDETAQPAPGDVGTTLRSAPINDAHVWLTWGAASGAATYHVERSASPQGPWSRIADVGVLSYEDRDQMGNSSSWYYRVKAADLCGHEGP